VGKRARFPGPKHKKEKKVERSGLSSSDFYSEFRGKGNCDLAGGLIPLENKGNGGGIKTVELGADNLSFQRDGYPAYQITNHLVESREPKEKFGTLWGKKRVVGHKILRVPRKDALIKDVPGTSGLEKRAHCKDKGRARCEKKKSFFGKKRGKKTRGPTRCGEN